MNVLNRPLFQRYARRPAPQGPVGIMASSPELMQAAARYNIGGLVERTDIDPFRNIKGRYAHAHGATKSDWAIWYVSSSKKTLLNTLKI